MNCRAIGSAHGEMPDIPSRRLQQEILLLPADAERDICGPDAPFRNLITLVDVSHLIVVNDQIGPAILGREDARIREQLILI